MKKSIMLLLVSGFASSFAFAEALCEGHAKFGAIRAYRAEIGVVQGSDGIQYDATLINNVEDNESTFLVSIDDNNEDGEFWTSNYIVQVSLDSQEECQVDSTNKVGVVVPFFGGEE